MADSSLAVNGSDYRRVSPRLPNELLFMILDQVANNAKAAAGAYGTMMYTGCSQKRIARMRYRRLVRLGHSPESIQESASTDQTLAAGDDLLGFEYRKRRTSVVSVVENYLLKYAADSDWIDMAREPKQKQGALTKSRGREDDDGALLRKVAKL